MLNLILRRYATLDSN